MQVKPWLKDLQDVLEHENKYGDATRNGFLNDVSSKVLSVSESSKFNLEEYFYFAGRIALFNKVVLKKEDATKEYEEFLRLGMRGHDRIMKATKATDLADFLA